MADPVLELKALTLSIGSGDNLRPLLSDVSAVFPKGHFAAIIGASGCGKSTLLKAIAGIAHGAEEGEIFWNSRNLVEEDFSPAEIGYVPQFSIAHEELTVGECVSYSTQLRVSGKNAGQLEEFVLTVLKEVGLEEFIDHRVHVLSGGQKRRLALAMELTSKPAMLLCDEVTSGLDPQSEDEIVNLLHGLSRADGRVVLSVTHSLQHIHLYDSVLVLVKGVLAYHGQPEYLAHYFQTRDPRDLYSQLEQREAADWAASWIKHRQPFLDAMLSGVEKGLEEVTVDSSIEEPPPENLEAPVEPQPEELTDSSPSQPGVFSQFGTLLSRRFRIFFRNRAQLLLQIGLIFGFPLLVAVFAWNGLPSIKNLSMGSVDVVQQLLESHDYLVQASKVGSLVSGIVMFQVILLTLMGANNSGREIAAERLIFEKEKLSGLSPFSYIASKAAFLFTLVIAQSAWMGLFVHYVCGFPGDFGAQLVFLVLVNAAMTSVCLGISSFMATAEQASLVSIYLVGFQLPLSGAVLALPDFVGNITRPFIAAYWSWSGILQTLREERYYDIVQMVIQTSLEPAALCLWVLCSHVIIGLFAAWLGCQRRCLE